MSTKFEQLLDYLVNENMEQANELFHEIVVEKSREIYENLIAEEEDDEEMDEAKEESDDEEMDEAKEESDEDQQDESMEMEDSYGMEGEEADDHGFAAGDASDEFGAEITGDEEEGPMDGEDAEDAAIFDFKDAFAKLEAAFAELEAAQSGEEAGDEFGGEEGEDEMMGSQAFEGRRMTREYVEKVGNDWEKSGSQKGQGQYVGARTGGTEGAPQEGRSPIASGKNKPGPAGVNASNILRGGAEGQSNTGDRPLTPVKGINPTSGEKFAKGIHNVDGAKSGVKTLSKVAAGHGAEKKGSGPGPVGAGTGDKAGQTSDATGTKKQFLPQYK